MDNVSNIKLADIQEYAKDYFVGKFSNPLRKALIEETKPDEAWWQGFTEGMIASLTMLGIKIEGMEYGEVQS